MDEIELSQRIVRGENLHTEFKLWPLRVNSLAETLVAFANADGGQLLLGIDDAGSVIGVEDPDRTMRTVDNVAYNNCEPPLTVLQETVPHASNAVVIVVNIPKGDQRPYRTNTGRYTIRTTSGRRPASRQELLRLFQASEHMYFDETLLSQTTRADLDSRAVERFFAQAQGYTLEQLGLSLDRVLTNWKLAQLHHEDLHLTLAGTLFFCDQPQYFVPYAYITAVRFPGVSPDRDPSDRKRVEGAMPRMLDDAMRFLNIHLPVRHDIHGMASEIHLELPPDALREALVNACAHRDYTIQSPIRLLIFDDRVEIRSPGGLPNTITLEALPLGVHVLRNPTIYNMLLRMGLVTDAGSGFPRMIARMRDWTGREPTWRLEGNEFVVALSRRPAQP
ncbi:MAG: hypothetical protein ETSY1_03105 [Candidatus Entotheonella factor]|uniref:Schlafen AlbA-2 domain-containing protein n=1 Tax=Entotheonella factor TaxID=1429438 RepID=W4LXD8_ENTF1|nr:MAG: hypothetical protein ETSY1_03105 [Candidatus Entotheonella factor]